MFQRLTAITFILLCTSVAWFTLAATIGNRTYQSDDKLRLGVASIWGAPEEQIPPIASYEKLTLEKLESETDGHKTTHIETHRESVPIPIDANRIDVTITLDHRKKGLLWYSTYVVDFAGAYTFHNPAPDTQTINYWLKFPAEHAIYDGLVMELNGRALALVSNRQAVSAQGLIGPQGTAILRVAYRSHGLESWRYRLGNEVSQARDFTLRVKTNFKQVDFPLNTLAPTEKHELPAGLGTRLAI